MESIGRAIRGLAQVFLAQNQAEQATQFLGLTSIYLGSPEKVTYPSLASGYRLTSEQARTLLDQQTFATAWSSGSQMTLGDALNICDQYRN